MAIWFPRTKLILRESLLLACFFFVYGVGLLLPDLFGLLLPAIIVAIAAGIVDGCVLLRRESDVYTKCWVGGVVGLLLLPVGLWFLQWDSLGEWRAYFVRYLLGE